MRTKGTGGLNMTKNTHFVRRFSENATLSETLLRHLLRDYIVRYFKKEHNIDIIPVKEYFKNIN